MEYFKGIIDDLVKNETLVRENCIIANDHEVFKIWEVNTIGNDGFLIRTGCGGDFFYETGKEICGIIVDQEKLDNEFNDAGVIVSKRAKLIKVGDVIENEETLEPLIVTEIKGAAYNMCKFIFIGANGEKNSYHSYNMVDLFIKRNPDYVKPEEPVKEDPLDNPTIIYPNNPSFQERLAEIVKKIQKVIGINVEELTALANEDTLINQITQLGNDFEEYKTQNDYRLERLEEAIKK